MITELIPSVGERAIFLEYWEENFNPNKSSNNGVNMKRRNENDHDDSSLSCSSKRPCNKENNSNNLNVSINDTVSSSAITRPVMDILQEGEIGKQILRHYETVKDLDESDRKKICELIVTDLINRDIRLRNEIAEKIAQEIVDIYPTEITRTYYIPPIYKSKSTVRNLKEIRDNVCLPKKKKIKGKMNEVNASQNDLTDESEDPDVQESLDWLRINEVPWNLVLDHWRKTSKIRSSEFRKSEDKNLTNLFKSWRLYQHVQGYELINIDFECANLSTVSLNVQNWTKFYEILKECGTMNSRDEPAKSLEAKLQSPTNLSNDSMILLSLSLLAHLYPPKTMRKSEKSNWRPSIGLSKDSIFRVAGVFGDLLMIKEDAKKKAAQRGVPLQPYVIIVGTVEEVQDTYVCIDEKLYKVNGVIHALDIVFKAFHVFSLEYPLASKHLWLLIQRGIYNFKTNFDEDISTVEHALHMLSQKMNNKS